MPIPDPNFPRFLRLWQQEVGTAETTVAKLLPLAEAAGVPLPQPSVRGRQGQLGRLIWAAMGREIEGLVIRKGRYRSVQYYHVFASVRRAANPDGPLCP